jgi:hypothetical protein
MSWDVAIVKIRGEFRPLEEVEPDDYLPLGKRSAVQKAIRKAFPSAQWSGPTQALYSAEEFAIDFEFDRVESSKTMVLHVSHGTGDPIPALLSLTEPNGWLIVDASTGEFIDPNDPSHVGWDGYKSLVTGTKPAKKQARKPALKSAKKSPPKKSADKSRSTLLLPTAYDGPPKGYTADREETLFIPPAKKGGKWTRRTVTARYVDGRLMRFLGDLLPVPPKGKGFTGGVALSGFGGYRGDFHIVTSVVENGRFVGQTITEIRLADTDGFGE